MKGTFRRFEVFRIMNLSNEKMIIAPPKNIHEKSTFRSAVAENKFDSLQVLN